jgi:hypothetical protein
MQGHSASVQVSDETGSLMVYLFTQQIQTNLWVADIMVADTARLTSVDAQSLNPG